MEIRNPKPVAGAAALRRIAAARSRVADASNALQAATEVVVAGIPETELTPRVQQALLALMGEVDQLRRQLEEARSRIAYLERLADEDALMPIANRRAFVRELSRMMAFAERYASPASVVYFDLNGLKQINDTFGHAAGDAALQHVSKVLLENVRNSDLVGRLGGDEFGVLLVQTDEQTAEKKAESLAAAIADRPLDWQGHTIAISAAYGTHSFSGTESADQAIDAADKAMYQHKHKGR
jgi:diguanylate cyclase (GGDEF)-like protein